MHRLRIKKSHIESIRAGCPWVMRHQAVESSEWLTLEAGAIVRVESERGEWIGIGMANPLSHIVCRMLSSKDEALDQHFFQQRIMQAMARRSAAFGKEAHYGRMIHSEADGLPGLVVDRFADLLVVQVGSAGMERLQPFWLAALESVYAPRAILFRNDIPARKFEGLSQEVRRLSGDIPDHIRVIENGCIYFADVLKGQKTGWFYDMRDNRMMMAMHAKNKTVLDVFSHSGGFGVLAAKHGAEEVTMVDSSQLALDLAMRAATENGVADRCQTIKGDAVEVMKNLAGEGKQYAVVIADPPAYVKSAKDVAAGLKGYEKVAFHASALVKSGGYFFTATCSHHAGRSAFNKAALAGLAQAGRKAEIVKQTSASADHPLHPRLPQSEYLKGLLLGLE